MSEFVIADRSEAEVIGETFQPSEKWPTLKGWKGIETIKLSTLYCAMTGEEYTNDLQASFELVGGDQNEGPWVFLFPDKVQNIFANFSESNLANVASEWVQTEELSMDGWTEDEAKEFIQQIVSHAKNAEAANKPLFLWYSL